MKIFKNSFSNLKKILLTVALAFAILLPPTLPAATPNYDIAVPGVVVIPFHLSGQYTATTANAVRFVMPFKCRIIGVGAIARASGGTSPTLTLDLYDDATLVLASSLTVTATGYNEGVISNPSVSDESVMAINLNIGGTSPTWNDIVVFMTVIRE